MHPLLALAFIRTPAPIEFDFADPKGVSAVSFSTDGVTEPFVGIAKGISGKLSFDPAQPERTTGALHVASESLELPMKPLEESMKAGWCLDVKGHPSIDLVVRRLEKVKTEKGRTTAMLLADFTLKGVTRPIRVPASATYLKGKAQERFGDDPGDLLVIRCDFRFNRLDFGVAKSLGENLVSNEVSVHVALVGTYLYPKKG